MAIAFEGGVDILEGTVQTFRKVRASGFIANYYRDG